MTTTKISSKLTGLIKKNKSFLIAGHINPEGDSLGSSLALALGLKKLGKKDICVVSRDSVPEILKFLPSAKMVKQRPPAKKQFDAALIVDCNTPARTGFSHFNAKETGVIDHHILSTDSESKQFYKTVSASLIDPSAAAAGVLVYKVLKALKVKIDKAIATNLYTAILVDTGGFRYSNTSTGALRIAADLVEAGAQPWEITKEVYESVPYNSMKLLGLSLSTIEQQDGIAWIKTTSPMFKKTNTTAEDSEDFVDFPRKLKGIKVAVFFRQDSAKSFKLSLRSKGNADVQKIAQSFGGGGHAAAAGCTVHGTFSEVQKKVLTAVRKAIRKT